MMKCIKTGSSSSATPQAHDTSNDHSSNSNSSHNNENINNDINNSESHATTPSKVNTKNGFHSFDFTSSNNNKAENVFGSTSQSTLFGTIHNNNQPKIFSNISTRNNNTNSNSNHGEQDPRSPPITSTTTSTSTIPTLTSFAMSTTLSSPSMATSSTSVNQNNHINGLDKATSKSTNEDEEYISCAVEPHLKRQKVVVRTTPVCRQGCCISLVDDPIYCGDDDDDNMLSTSRPLTPQNRTELNSSSNSKNHKQNSGVNGTLKQPQPQPQGLAMARPPSLGVPPCKRQKVVYFELHRHRRLGASSGVSSSNGRCSGSSSTASGVVSPVGGVSGRI
ncbi:unnamed protein product [Ambrosiozyma monospora]|uniref:Unnamed protein product n=1 Tax=Ambrosiozyma monospora TaxID=43982 RepID=A0ACB5TY46_AMBMO|nr:unnamed protein product [Ambrosiozyma monospora]